MENRLPAAELSLRLQACFAKYQVLIDDVLDTYSRKSYEIVEHLLNDFDAEYRKSFDDLNTSYSLDNLSVQDSALYAEFIQSSAGLAIEQIKVAAQDVHDGINQALWELINSDAERVDERTRKQITREFMIIVNGLDINKFTGGAS